MLKSLWQGLGILRHYTDHLEIEPVPASFSNGAPASSTQAYVAVCVGINQVTEEQRQRLIKMKWRPEQGGEWWVFPGRK